MHSPMGGILMGISVSLWAAVLSQGNESTTLSEDSFNGTEASTGDPGLETTLPTTGTTATELATPVQGETTTPAYSETDEDTTIREATIPTTTTTTTSTTTSARPSTQNKALNHSLFLAGAFCTCDLSVGSCDANCCCDPDCSFWDKKAFSDCSVAIPPGADGDYCYTTEVFEVNSTQFAVGIAKDGRFCLFQADTEAGLMFEDRDVIENVTDFDRLKSRHARFLWPREQHSKVDPLVHQHYRQGDPLLIEDDLHLTRFVLPMALNDRHCNSHGTLKFMSPTRHSCQHRLEPSRDCSREASFNLQTFTRGFQFVKSPILLTGNASLRSDALLPVEVQICRNEAGFRGKTCLAIKPEDAVPEPTSNCDNVLRNLHLEFIHSGVEGLEKVTAYAELVDQSSLELERDFQQDFHVSYFWQTDNLTDIPLRSGNPGYLNGKPLRTGTLVMDEDSGLWVIRMFSNPRLSTVSLIPQFPSGECGTLSRLSDPRLPILFNENLRLGCSILVDQPTIAQQCKALRNQTLNLLVGAGGLDLLRESMVASFGNSEPDFPGDWVPVLVSNAPSPEGQGNSNREERPGLCSNVVLSLHIEIVHAKAGSLANPQAKIIGINYRFGPPQDIKVRCLGQSCQSVYGSQRIEVFTSVAFVDVSQRAEDRYAEFPVIEAKLPHDFFYPFVSSEVIPSGVDRPKAELIVLALLIIGCSARIQRIWDVLVYI